MPHARLALGFDAIYVSVVTSKGIDRFDTFVALEQVFLHLFESLGVDTHPEAAFIVGKSRSPNFLRSVLQANERFPAFFVVRYLSDGDREPVVAEKKRTDQ